MASAEGGRSRFTCRVGRVIGLMARPGCLARGMVAVVMERWGRGRRGVVDEADGPVT